MGAAFVKLHNGGFTKLEHPEKQWILSQKVQVVNQNQPFLSATNSLLVHTKHRALGVQRDHRQPLADQSIVLSIQTEFTAASAASLFRFTSKVDQWRGGGVWCDM